jgi:hypothetical protein
MLKVWILVVWFSTTTNYAYVPTVIGEFPTLESCIAGLNKFKEPDLFGPDGVCIEKPIKSEIGKERRYTE